MAGILDFLTKPKTHAPKQQGEISKTLTDILNATGDTGNAWLQTLLQIPNAMQGKPLTPIAQPNASAQRGLSDLQGMLMGAPSAEIAPTAIRSAEGAMNQGAQATSEAFQAAKAQPGGMQAGFLRTGNNISQAASPVRVTLKPSVYSAGREAAVQNTVDNIVPGATAGEKYSNLQPTMDRLGNQITQVMNQNPKSASLQQVMSDYDKNLQNEGVYRTSSTPRDQIQKTAQGYITDLQNEASGGNATLNPNQISDVGLQRIKQQVNQDAQSIFKKIDNGTTLTDKDRVILSARQTIDDTITSLHPEVKQLTTQQSHLYDAAESLFKGREAEVKSAAEAPSGGNFLTNLMKKAGEHPVISNAATLATVLGAPSIAKAASQNLVPAVEMGAKDFMDRLKNSGSPNNPGLLNSILGINKPQTANAASSQPKNSASGQEQQQTRYSLPDPMQSGAIMNTQNYSNQKAALQKQFDYEQQYQLPTAGITKGKIDSLDTQYNAQQPLRDSWSNPKGTGVSQQLSVANYAAQAVQKADPEFFNALQGGYDQLQKASSGKYAQMSQYLKYLTVQTGTDFTQFKTKDALMGAIDSSVEAIKSNWTNQLRGFSGSSNPQDSIPPGPAGNGGNGVQGAPAGGIKAFAPGFNFGGQL